MDINGLISIAMLVHQRVSKLRLQLRWLILLQPWKAPRLYQWYLSLRSPEPKLEAPVPG